MRLQSITRSFLPSAILFSLVHTLYVPSSPTHHLSSTKDTAANSASRGDEGHALYQPMINNRGSTISKRDSPRSPEFKRGYDCGKTFYPESLIKEIGQKASKKLEQDLNKWWFSTRKKMMSCAPNIPHCHYNFPHAYKGPEEYFGSQKDLYEWPIVTGRWRKWLGFKGYDRIVFKIGNYSRVVGLVRKVGWRKWKACSNNWGCHQGTCAEIIIEDRRGEASKANTPIFVRK